MKKISIMLLAALALGFTACEDYEPAQPQSNPQEPIMSAEGITVSAGKPTFDLNALESAGADAVVLNVTQAQNIPAAGELAFVMQLAKTEDFAETQNVATEIVNNQVCVAPADWQAAHQKVFGKNPKAQDAYVRFAAYVVNGTSSVRIGNPELYFGAQKVSVTPFAAPHEIEEAYSIVIKGGETIQFYHSDVDQYDDPIFTVKIKIESEIEWAIKGAKFAYTPVASETDDKVGSLVASEGWCKTSGNGPYELLVNMETLTYSFAPAFENLYTPGDANGWNHGGSQMLATTDYVNYYGFANLSANGFKFTSAADWDHINYGNAGEEGMLTTDGSAGNLTVAESGLYWCDVNIDALTWKATKIETIGVIGGFNGWSESLPLTSEDGLFWIGTVTFNAGDEFKFRCNNDWAINLGGEDQYALVPNGANLKATETGTFNITLDLSVVPYACYIDPVE